MKDRGGKLEGSHSFSLSAERCLALGFFPHFLLKVGKAQLQLPGLGRRSDGTASHGSWGPSWPPRLCRSQGMDLPLSLLDRVELNCPFYFFFNTFASCLSGIGTGEEKEVTAVGDFLHLPSDPFFIDISSILFLPLGCG